MMAATFRFRLQRVLDLRVQEEQAAASRLAAARGEAERAHEACRELERARSEDAQRLAAQQAGRSTIGALQNLRYLVEQLDGRIEQARRQLEQVEKQVAERVREHGEAFKGRRVLERLRERHLENHRAEQARADQQAMDDIALTRFVRAEPTQPEEEQP